MSFYTYKMIIAFMFFSLLACSQTVTKPDVVEKPIQQHVQKHFNFRGVFSPHD